MPEKLNDDQIKARLAKLPDWSIENGMLTKTFTFSSYGHGVMFASGLGYMADSMDHHPDLELTYQKVKVSLVTHDAGGLTANDFDLADKAEQMA